MIGALDSEATAAMMEAFNKACQSLHDWRQPDVITDLFPSGLSKLLRWVSATLINFVNGPSNHWGSARALVRHDADVR